MKKTKKMFVFVFAMFLAVLMSVPANADILSSSKVTATIDSQLQSLLKDVSEDKKIPVDIWLYETSTNEVREQRILTRIGINKAQIVADTRGAISSKKIDEYIMAERSMYAAERVQQYALIQRDYAKIQGLQETRSANTRLFYSQYAPMISAELTSAEINMLARDSRVQSIYYSPDVTLLDDGDVSFPAVGADYARDTLGYTGSGIKIGMIEHGIPDSTESYFAGVDITYDNFQYSNHLYSYHADMVASIMVGQETTFHGITYGEGIVPDAKLFVTCFDPEVDNDWRMRMEWLLSQGVHVINMSAYIPDAILGHYGSNERWVDHIVNSHNVYFVKTTGNVSAGVNSPGLAYNILTVGAINDKNTVKDSDDTLYDGSSYVEFPSQTQQGETIYPTNKPDLVAPGVDITTAAGTYTGTSFAAPHVTAIVAQLCEYIGSLKVMPAVGKAILTASVSHSEHAYNTGFMGEGYDKFGAGVVNAKAAFETALAFRMMGGSFFAGSEAQSVRFFTFTASDGQRVRVSLTWQKYAYLPDNVSHVICDPSELGIVDLDLCIYDPDGVLVGDWRADNNNTEIADFIASQSGTYTIGVYLNESPTYEVPIGLAWWLAPANSLSTSG